MVQINNQEMKAAFSNSTKTQLAEQPNSVDNRNVITTIDITPRIHKIANMIKGTTLTNATSVTIYTTPTTQDFYLTNIQASYIKDATSTCTGIAIEGTPKDTGNSPLLRFAALTLTAAQNSDSVIFNPPLLMKRGSSINITSDTAVANIKCQAQICGYTEDAQ